MLAQEGASRRDEVAGRKPAFEVASVRPVLASKRGMTDFAPYGSARFSVKNASFRILLQMAYDTDHIEGAPKGTDDAYFDVEAKAEGGLSLSYSSLQPRLQQLLEQRFQLTAHMIRKPLPGYALLLAKGSPKLTPATSSSVANPHAYIMQDRFEATGIASRALASVLSNVLHRPVEDETGLPGNYDVKLKYAPEDAADSPYPTIFTALKEQLGLELKPHPVEVKVLVVDHVDLTPTEN